VTDAPRHTPVRAPAPSPLALGVWGAAGLASAALLVAACRVAPQLRVSAITAYLAGFVAVSAMTLATAAAVPRLPRGALAGVLLAITALVLVQALDLARGSSVWGAAVITVALLLGATCVGSVVGSAMRHPGHLLVVAVVFTLVDTFSVFHEAGPTAAIVQYEELLSLVALPFPMLGSPGPTIEPFLGLGDVIAAALFVSASRTHALGTARTLVALGGAFALTMVSVLTTEQPLPVLPFMGAAMLVAHPRARRLPREDRKPALLGLGLLMLAYAAVWRWTS
jgi:hypothetical protein